MGRILITGATGLIGRNLVNSLSERHTFYALTNRPIPDPTLPVEWIRQDLSQPLNVHQLPDQIDSVIHLAQSVHYRDFPDKAQDIFDVGVNSTLRLLDFVRRKKNVRFILASSGGIYGWTANPVPFRESDPFGQQGTPLGFYLTSKYLGELLASFFSPLFPIIVLRFFFVYGPGQRDSMLIPSLLNKLRNQKLITVDGNPGLGFNPIFVEDATYVFEPALRLQESAVFNVAGEEHLNISSVVHCMEHVSQQKALIHYNESVASGYLLGDNTRMKVILGVQPKVRFVDGIRTLL